MSRLQIAIDAIITKTTHANDAAGNNTKWGDIKEAIEKELDITNWMIVRNVLQFQLDEKEINRTSDLNVEEYVLVK